VLPESSRSIASRISEDVARFLDVRLWSVRPDTMVECAPPAWVRAAAPGATFRGPPPIAAGDRFHVVACLEQAARRGRAEAIVRAEESGEDLLIVALDVRPTEDALVVLAGPDAAAGRTVEPVGLDSATELLDSVGLLERLRALPIERDAAIFLARVEGLSDVVRTSVEAGDVVAALADRFRARLAERGWWARIDVDTFALLVTEDLDELDGSFLADRIAELVRQPIAYGDRALEFTAAIGWSVGRGRRFPTALLYDAGVALAEASRHGVGRTVAYSERLRERITRRSTLRHDLPSALARDELFLDFQPIHDLHDLTPIGAEALMRWQHPDYGLLRPADFIPLAEESGVIADLGWWLADQAVRALVALRGAFAPASEFTVAINVSGRQLNDDRLVRDLDRVIELHRIDPSSIVVELTETALMAGDQGIETLLRVADLGCRIAVDDFGAGFASLDYLSRLPVDSVKLHPSFVHRIDEPRVTRLVAAVLVLCRQLGVGVVAEGIESSRQLKRLRELGVGYGQGYLLGRPVALDGLIGEEAAAGVSRPRSGPAVLVP